MIPSLRTAWSELAQNSSRSENIIWRCNEEGELSMIGPPPWQSTQEIGLSRFTLLKTLKTSVRSRRCCHKLLESWPAWKSARSQTAKLGLQSKSVSLPLAQRTGRALRTDRRLARGM